MAAVKAKAAKAKPAKAKPELEAHKFASPAALDRWLAKNHATSPGIWVLLAKKGTGVASVTYADIRDLALAWGWIDGQGKAVDETFYGLRFTPRGKKSVWSKINVERVEALTREGKMHPSGQACVDAAKADGRWERAYEPPSRATVPPDLEAALARDAALAKIFADLDAANRFSVITRLQFARTPELRAKKLAELVAMLSRGDTPHPKRVARKTTKAKTARS